MLQEQIYNYLLSILEQNQQGIQVSGGYTYTHYNSQLRIIDLSTLHAMKYDEVEVVPFAENFLVERSFVESINRSEYESEYVIIFPIEKENECIAMLQDFRDTIFSSPTTTIIDDGKTYKAEFKTTRGQKKTVTDVDDGTVYVIYAVNIFMTLVENGFLSSNTTFKIAKAGETLQTIDIIEYSVATESATDPNSKFSGDNITQEAISRSVGGSVKFYYSGSDIDKVLLNQASGKGDREQLYDIEIVIDDLTLTYGALVKKGDFTVIRGAVFYLTISWVEA